MTLLAGVGHADTSDVHRRIPDPYTGTIHEEGQPVIITSKMFQRPAAQNDSTVKSDVKSSRGDLFRRSMLLPGWGQLKEGKTSKGYVFIGLETALISGLIGSYVYSRWIQSDYESFARQHGGIIDSHPHQFYVDAGNWTDNRSFNEKRLQERDFEALYTNPNDVWNWDIDSHRRSFKAMRIASDAAAQLVVFMVGGLVINHLASAIDAARGYQDEPTVTVRPEWGNGGGKVSVGIRIR